jgi:outer membrane protein
MEVGGRGGRLALLFLSGICLWTACETVPREMSVSDVTGRRAHEVAQQRLAESQPSELDSIQPIPTRMIGPTSTQPEGSLEAITLQVPDPREFADVLRESYRPEDRPPGVDEAAWHSAYEQYTREAVSESNAINRPQTVRLTLGDVISRSLRHSYAIQTEAYGPAIESTKIVEAEAQFDAVFFTNFEYNKADKPAASELEGTVSDTRLYGGGIRKLLSTGMQVEVSYNLSRTANNLQFQTLNPSYFDQFGITFTQPLLRNFGIDYNQSRIDNARLERDKSIETLKRNIRETLYNTEVTYWRLFQARRNYVATIRLLINFRFILDSFQQRLRAGFDVYPSVVSQVAASLESTEATRIRAMTEIKNQEDALKKLMNDPDLNQAADIEIIPIDTPTLAPIVVDLLSELTAALENRAELHETKLTIQQAQIAIGVAKNQALPKLDLTFRYLIDGLGTNPSRAFKDMSNNDYTEYVAQLQFEWPIGNRGPEAALRRARLQQAQAIAAHRDQLETVITEVNTSIRILQSSYDQIGPNLRSAQASLDQLRSTIIRGEKRDPPTLQVELDAHTKLFNARQQLLQVLADYNIALIDLERRKGTLLEYNNIVLRGTNEDGYLKPYEPLGP